MDDKARIEMDFGKAQKQANNLERIANDMKRLSNVEISETLQKISNSWQGENAELYVRKGSILQDQILDTRKKVLRVANKIQRSAKNIYNAEMEAIKIAENES